MLRVALILSVAGAVLCPATPAVTAEPSCSYSYPDSTLYVYGVKQHTVRVDIVDTDTEAVLHQVYAYKVGPDFYIPVTEYASDVDATTEFVVYSNNGKIDGGGGKIVTECYA